MRERERERGNEKHCDHKIIYFSFTTVLQCNSTFGIAL